MNGPARAPAPSGVRPVSLMREYLGRHRGRFIAGFLLLAVTNLLALSVPRLLKHAVEALQATDRRGIVLFSGAIVVVALVQAFVRTLSRLAILGASREVAYELRNRLFAHLQMLPLSRYNRRPIGDITSRAVNDMQLVRSVFGFGLMNLVNTSMVYITAVSMMFIMDPRLTLYALAPFPIFMFAVNRLSRRIYGLTLAVQQQLAALTSRAQENLSAMNLIKTYAREEPEARRWSEMSSEYLRKTLALARARGAMVPLMGVMASAGTLVVIGLGGRAVIDSRIGLGDFVAFNAYLAFLVWPTFAFGWILNTFQRGAAALRRIGEILDEPAEDRELPVGAPAEPLKGSITLSDLTFTHDEAPEGVRHLDGLNLHVPAGSTLGVLGTVGSGKSTLISLLPRLLEAPAGTVLLDGREIETIPLARLRRDIAVVPQESFLFSRTIRQNVALAPRDFTDAEVDDAVQMSRLSKDLPSFPNGLETVVGERGFTLSGGQRQRATIARAAITSPSVLVMDDALSSLDAEVEQEIIENLKRRKSEQTMIIVSNRVASLAWADQIIVMDRGAIVERGTHDDLVRAEGLYARIARRQSLAARLEEDGP